MAEPKDIIIPCALRPDFQEKVFDYVMALKSEGYKLGAHGLSKEDFDNSGIFDAAVERVRGTRAASMKEKQNFISLILDFLQQKKKIRGWEFTGAGERHDYQVILNDGRISIIEAKGCLDGNNTGIFKRPPNADEFIIWSLCQNQGSDPRKNAWSGVHTRLGPTIIADNERVDGLVIFDMLCGTFKRPCPKLINDTSRATKITNDLEVPPPCIYLFPRTKPDPRNNPSPDCWNLDEVKFLDILAQTFKCDHAEITQIKFECEMRGQDLFRKTVISRNGAIDAESKWTKLKRAK